MVLRPKVPPESRLRYAVTGARSAERKYWRNCRLGGARARAHLAALLVATMAAGHILGVASAQQGRLDVIVPAFLSVEPAAEVVLPIRITPPDAVPRGGFLKLRGLPATAALSDGHSIAPGAWAIPMTALPNLRILMPVGAKGRSDVLISLLSPDGAVLAEAKATLVVASASPPSNDKPADQKAGVMRIAPAPASPVVSPREPPTGPALTLEARERALRLVKKGDEQLAEGGIAQARLLYERAAEAGLALGAMAMAATYDAAELERLGTRGLKPDREAARRWYERARELGAAEAEGRLRRLGANY